MPICPTEGPRNIKEMLALGRISCENWNDQNASAKDLGPIEHMLNRLLRSLDSIAVATRIPDLPLDVEKLCATALSTAKRNAFSDRSFVEPMQVLFESYDREANLNIAGRYSARWDALRCLANLLRFDAEEERDGTILSERIERPIFITGLPRSGTTLLH